MEYKLSDAIKAGEIEEMTKTRLLKKLSTTDTSNEFETCDLVIEAVFENKMVKEVYKVVEKALKSRKF